MSFVFFDGSHTPTAFPRITVRRGGLIVLNAAAVTMLGEGVTHVQLGYDVERRAIGLRKAPEDALGKYILRKPPKGFSRIVNGKRLMAHYGLNTDKATSYNVEDFGDGLIGFTLPEAKAGPAKAAKEPEKISPAKTAKEPAKTARRTAKKAA